jgi:hypothetical protein
MPIQPLRRARAFRPWVRMTALAAVVLAGAATPTSGKVVPPPRGTPWIGTYDDASGLRAEKQARLNKLEAKLGQRIDVDHNYTIWTDPFPGWREAWDRDNGRVPFVSWAGTSTKAVNAGKYDSMIRARALDVKAAGYPILLEWFWEMDGDRNRDKAVSPASFIAAWRRIHTIFEKAGVTNASWVWCPNAWGFKTGEAPKWYPGDRYVDWLCANGYNWAPGRKGDEWRSFQTVFQPFYDWASGRGKPLMIGEFGVQERKSGEKAQWLKDATATLRTKFPAIRAVVYFNVDRTYNWRIDTSTSAFRAFKSMFSLSPP